MERKKYCVIACGGHGSRMGGDVPKQFLRINGKTILQYTIERLLQALPDLEIICVLPKDWVEFWREECAERGIRVRQRLVCGGITRFHSVKNALAFVPDGAVVAVHDGVRPLVLRDFLVSLFDAAESDAAVIPVVPVVDTLKVLKRDSEGRLRPVEGASADRSILFGAQTPQIFHSELLKQAYAQPYLDSFTDDDSVVRSFLQSSASAGRDTSEGISHLSSSRSSGCVNSSPGSQSSGCVNSSPGSQSSGCFNSSPGSQSSGCVNSSPGSQSSGCVCYLPGERYNIKITTPQDLSLAELLLGK